MKHPNSGGYIALTSVIIMSLLLITITVGLSTANYFSRFNILESEYKERSSSLADACVNQAIFNLTSGSSYKGPVTFGTNVCKICDVVTSGTNKIITVQGLYQNSFTNLQVSVKNSNFTINSWQEVPSQVCL